MSSAQLMMSLAGIAGGLGKGGTRAPTGVAKERLHLKNLQPWERDGAKAEYEQIVAEQKAARAAAIAEWFNRYPAAMPVEYRKIDKVVAAFLVGKYAEAPNSGVSTDGGTLTVQGKAVASRSNANDRFITVCPGQYGESKAARYAANSTLRHMSAGVRVSDILRGKGDTGYAFFSPTRSPSQGRIVVPDACLRVEVSKKMREKAMATAYGVDQMGPVQVESRGPSETYDEYTARLLTEHKASMRRRRTKPRGSRKNPTKQAALKARLKKKYNR